MATATQPIPIPMLDNPVSDTGRFSRPWTQYLDKLNTAVGSVGVGATDGGDAAAGQIGEYRTASGSVTLSNGVAANIATLPLTAGDWDVSGHVAFTPAATTHPSQIGAGISATPGSLGTGTLLAAAFNVGAALSLSPGSQRFSYAGAQTAYLVGSALFTTAGMTASGTITARRAR